MNKYFKKIIQLLITLTLLPFAYADIAPIGPEITIIFSIFFLAIIGGIVVGTVYVAYLILKWVKNKYSKKQL